MDFDEIRPLRAELNIRADEERDFNIEYLETQKRDLEYELTEIKEKIYSYILMDPQILTKGMESPMEELRENYNDMFWELIRNANQIHEIELAIEDAAYGPEDNDVRRFIKEWSEARAFNKEKSESRDKVFGALGLNACNFDDHTIYDYLYVHPDIMESYMSAEEKLTKKERKMLLERIKSETEKALRDAVYGCGKGAQTAAD